MVTPATSFCDAVANLEKLVGGEGCVITHRNPEQNLFFFVLGTFVAYETSAGLFPTDYLRPELYNRTTVVSATANPRPGKYAIGVPGNFL